jgi:hypothetical protein
MTILLIKNIRIISLVINRYLSSLILINLNLLSFLNSSFYYNYGALLRLYKVWKSYKYFLRILNLLRYYI